MNPKAPPHSGQDSLADGNCIERPTGIWKEWTLQDLAGGNRESFCDGDWVESEHIQDAGVRLVQTGNIGIGIFLDKSDKKYINDNSFRSLRCTEVRPGDLLLCRLADPAGRACVLPDIGEQKIITSVDVTIFRPLSSLANRTFLSNVFSTAQWFRDIDERAGGTTHKRISRSALGRIVVRIPGVAEQTVIAEALSDADALIESLEQLLAKKRDLKQGAMQELLTGKRRLPGFETSAPDKRTDLGVIPGDWDIQRLGDIGESLIGLTYAPEEVSSDGVLVLRSSNIQNEALSFADSVFVAKDIPERIMVRAGDILVCVRNGSRDLIGKCVQLDGRCHGMTFGAFMAIFRTPSANFVYRLFQSSVIKRQVHEHLGATINQITNKSLNSFRIPFPPTEVERAAIAAVLSDMDAEIEALEAKLAKARQIKQGMMQELLTGRIRLV